MLIHELHAIMMTFFITGLIMHIRNILIILSLTLSLANCMSYDFSRRVVQQGNLLPKEKFQQLKIGMNKNEVANIMGTSLIAPTFNNERWDYAYTRRKGNSATTVKNLTLYFTQDTLSRIEHQP